MGTVLVYRFLLLVSLVFLSLPTFPSVSSLPYGPKLYKEFRFGSLSIFEYKCIELRRFLAASWNWYLVPMFWCWRYRGGASRNGCLSFCSRAALAYDSIFAYIFVGLTPSCIGTSSLIRRVEKAAESALSYLLLARLGCLATSLTSVWPRLCSPSTLQYISLASSTPR